MSQKFAATQQLYNRYAKDFVDHFEKKQNEVEVSTFLSYLSSNAYILDAGCGTAIAAAIFMARGYRVLGIDLSASLLEEAKRLHPEVPVQEMDLTNITLPREEFDGIWAKACILHLDREELPGVLDSFHTILKPGGVLYIQTKEGQGQGEQPVPFNPQLVRLFTFYSLSEIKELMSQHGFEILKDYTFNGLKRGTSQRDQDWVVVIGRKRA